MKIIASVVKNGVVITKTYSCWDLFYEDTFSPDTEYQILQVIED